MKILIFSTAYLPFIGGAEIAVKEICERIPDVQFDMITARMDPKLPQEERIGNVNVYRIGFGHRVFDKLILAFYGHLFAKRLDKKNVYDTVWSIMASQGGIAAGKFKRKHPEKRLVLTLQEGDEEKHLMRYTFGIKWLYAALIKPLHLLPFRQADHITVLSEDLKNRARANSEAEISIVPNGVAVSRFSEPVGNENIKRLRNELGFKDENVMVLTVSRLVKKNAVGDIILAMENLDENVKLVIIGSGPDEKALKALVDGKKLDGRVIFLGSIKHDKLPVYLQSAQVFTRPSISEGFGNVFVEAMAAGVPVIATPVGGITDFLYDPDSTPENDPTGLFCEVANPESLAAQIRRLIFEPLLVKELVANARALVTQRYDWDIIAKKMVNVFKK